MGKGSMSFQLKTARLTMIVINIVIFLIGATLIGEGADLMLNPNVPSVRKFFNVFENLSSSKKNVFPTELVFLTMILPGFILASVGFCGCSGAVTQIQCILHYYATIIGILLCFQTFVIILILHFRSTCTKYIVSTVMSKIQNQYQGPLSRTASSSSLLIDYTMYRLKCCGISHADDFILSNNWNRTNPWWDSSMPIEKKFFRYPLTCCQIDGYLGENRLSLEKVIDCAVNGTSIYTMTCAQRITNGFSALVRPSTIILLLIYLIEMFILMFVFVIYHRNRVVINTFIMEDLPPSYSSRTRINHSRVYFQI